MAEGGAAPTADGSCAASVRFAPTHHALGDARAIVRALVEFGDEHGERSFMTAMTEILVNSIEEHVRIGIAEAIVVSIELLPEPSVVVADRGRGFDREVERSRSGEPGDVRGRGLAIAAALVPRTSTTSDERGTTTRMPVGPGRLRRSLAGAAAPA